MLRPIAVEHGRHDRRNGADQAICPLQERIPEFSGRRFAKLGARAYFVANDAAAAAGALDH